MKKIILIIIILFTISCKKTNSEEKVITKDTILSINTETTPAENPDELIKYRITDSLFIGVSDIEEPDFIKYLESGGGTRDKGGDGYSNFEDYEKILKRSNKLYDNWNPQIPKRYKLTPDLELQLSRLKFLPNDKKKDIQIILYTNFKGVKKDSILFYKYLIDKDFPKQQRFEKVSFIDYSNDIYTLNTNTDQSELAIGIEEYSKYNIDKKTGKITILEKNINYSN